MFKVNQYLRSRAVRLLPPLAFASLLTIVLGQLAPFFFESGSNSFAALNKEFMTRVNFSAPTQDVIGSLFLMNGFFTNTFRANTPLWSLSIEAWYYLVAGLVFWRGTVGKVLAIGVFALGCYKNTVFMNFSIVWFSGLALSLLQVYAGRLKIPLILIGCGLYAAAFSCGASYVESFSEAASLKQVDTSSLPYYSVFIGLAFTTTLALIIEGRLRFRPFLANCSKFSYTLYVIHFPIYLFVYGVFEHKINSSALSAASYTAATALLILVIAIPAAWFLEGWTGKILNEKGKASSQGLSLTPKE